MEDFLHTYMLVDLKWVSWIRLNSLGRKLLLVVKQKQNTQIQYHAFKLATKSKETKIVTLQVQTFVPCHIWQNQAYNKTIPFTSYIVVVSHNKCVKRMQTIIFYIDITSQKPIIFMYRKCCRSLNYVAIEPSKLNLFQETGRPNCITCQKHLPLLSFPKKREMQYITPQPQQRIQTKYFPFIFDHT